MYKDSGGFFVFNHDKNKEIQHKESLRTLYFTL